MKKFTNILTIALILTISASCEEVKKTTFENHTIYVFSSEEDVRERAYLLEKESHDTLIKYTYQYKRDNDRNIELRYFPKTNIINFGLDDFEEIEGAEFRMDTISKSLFKKYRSKSKATDSTEPIFFNEEYGVLAIGNVMAPTFIFLPIESDLIAARKIFNKILNKMEKTAELIE
ncbi:hypothetical protein [Maribacter dokdonensis]|uniref:hypothetical protein n=1 Tax=Maribacter dokdonensis TaxID=320912 RepID=UPI001C082FAE|nr:hypothetical protein [Maribacter dokdonensis]MBU2899561.1 hypothetical protein [Maribacter dokdonensis]